MKVSGNVDTCVGESHPCTDRCAGVILNSEDLMFCVPSRYASRLPEDAFLGLDTQQKQLAFCGKACFL